MEEEETLDIEGKGITSHRICICICIVSHRIVSCHLISGWIGLRMTLKSRRLTSWFSYNVSQQKTVARRGLIDAVTNHASRAQKGSGQRTARLHATPALVASTPTTISVAKTVELVNTLRRGRTNAYPAVLERSQMQKRPAALLVNLGNMPTTPPINACPAPWTHIRRKQELTSVLRVVQDRILVWAKASATPVAQVNTSIRHASNA